MAAALGKHKMKVQEMSLNNVFMSYCGGRSKSVGLPAAKERSFDVSVKQKVWPRVKRSRRRSLRALARPRLRSKVRRTYFRCIRRLA